jgi:hypothetical protein
MVRGQCKCVEIMVTIVADDRVSEAIAAGGPLLVALEMDMSI